MFQVSAEVYEVISLAARYFFALFIAFLALRGLSQTLAERREEQEQLRHLPGAGTVGELVVVSGGQHLDAETWFPVPREGVLGSLRTCDLAVEARGVAGHHLDFCWKDGVGLLLKPRRGCQVFVNDQPLDESSAPETVPLTHGAILRIGEASLRFLVFAALDPTGGRFTAPAAEQSLAAVPPSPPGTVPVQAYISEEGSALPPVYPSLPEAMPPPIVIPAREHASDPAPQEALPSPWDAGDDREAIPGSMTSDNPAQPLYSPSFAAQAGSVFEPSSGNGPEEQTTASTAPPVSNAPRRRRSIASSEVPADSPYRRPGRPDSPSAPVSSPASIPGREDSDAPSAERGEYRRSSAHPSRRADRWKEDWSE